MSILARCQTEVLVAVSTDFPLTSWCPNPAEGSRAFVLLPPTTSSLPSVVLAWLPSTGQSWDRG